MTTENFTYKWDEAKQQFHGVHEESGLKVYGDTLRATRYALYALVTAHYEQQKQLTREVMEKVAAEHERPEQS